MIRRLLFAALALIGAPAFAQDAAAWREGDRGRGPVIELFSEPGFQGQSRLFYGEADNLAREGFNDAARSVRVRGAWQVCRDAWFAGRCEQLSSSEADLGRLGLANQISSLRPVSSGGGGWRREGLRLFEFEGFQGRMVQLDGPSDNLNAQRFNDAARSLSARGRWVVCEHAFFGGRCREVEGDVPDLRALGLWGLISSARPAEGHDDGGWRPPGHGGAIDRPPVEGRTGAFFPQPRRGGVSVPACGEWNGGRACHEASVDRFCRDAGYREGKHYAIGRDRQGREVLEDVFCAR